MEHDAGEKHSLISRLKTFFGSDPEESSSANSHAHRSNGRGPAVPLPDPYTRPSNGLEQFFSSLRDRSGLNILDFGGASQANVTYITSMGHRLASEDFLRAVELTFGENDPLSGQANPQLVNEFLQDNLAFPPDGFDGALVWDALQFLSPHLLQITVDRLFDTLRPGAYLLALFPADEKARQLPIYSYRIADYKNLLLTPRGYRKQAQFFNNRSLERMFHRFGSVKFFLTRDNLREILVKR